LANGDGVDSAAAFDARGLLEGMTVSLIALMKWGVVFVLAHEFIGPIVAVLDAITTLRVLDNLVVGAHKAVREAGTSDVVTDGSCGYQGGNKHDDQTNNGETHDAGLILMLFSVERAGFQLRVERERERNNNKKDGKG
jgi:phosphate/sulfate permease